jgi:hypothetical protein
VAFVSITRLRVRSWRYMPAFFVQSLRSAWQAKSEIGCLAVAVLRDTGNAFWTQTVWENEDAMRSFMLSGVHQRGMHRLREWCDEASVVHWHQESPQPPSWDEAHQYMQRDGRPSMVNHPSLAHRSYKIPLPKVRPGQELRLK